MAKAGAKRRPAKPRVLRGQAKKPDPADGFRVDVDLFEAERAAERVRGWLASLRERHPGLQRYEFTRHIRIAPGGPTHSHPILTLGTRFAETEDHLLATYLHEQMHWYLWRLGGPDHDPVAPFFDELVRRYPKAPTRLPDGARNYEQTYVHLVVCWLELQAVSEFIGWERATALAETNYGYRWIYRTVVRDRDALGELFKQHGILPIQTPAKLLKAKPIAVSPLAAPKRMRAAKQTSRPPKARRKTQARGGKRTG